jgi:Druantia protein DruA
MRYLVQQLTRKESSLENEFKDRIYASLGSQGFSVTPELRPKCDEKETLRRIHKVRRREQLKLHHRALKEILSEAREYHVDGNEIKPEEIELELREVRPDSKLARLFLWWNLVWWSLPYEHPIGRYMRFIIWDKKHDAPFGLLGLQSPPLRSGVRDHHLKLKNGSIDYWINQSMYAQRVGALPPYNGLLGGKMVALSIVCNEIRHLYSTKYTCKTLLRKRRIPSRLLFTTTTSAYGRSSVYERLVFEQKPVNEFIGFTSGSGTFHLSEALYKELLNLLASKGVSVKRGYGTGPSRKLKLINRALRVLEIPNLSFHNIRRGYYFFPNVSNLQDVIHHKAKPNWLDRPFESLAKHWRDRWCIPRSKRVSSWVDFDSKGFFNRTSAMINRLDHFEDSPRSQS